jgi:hypothetical protein
MSYISIDPKTYRRLQQFAQRTGVSIHAAATDAVENWLDITTDPRLAITALTTIALTSPDSLQPDQVQPEPAPPAALPRNVTFINANLGAPPHHRNDSARKRAQPAANPIEELAR